jgi:hypothetical protein
MFDRNMAPLSLFFTEIKRHGIKLLRNINKNLKNAEQEPEVAQLVSLLPIALCQRYQA